MRRHYDVAIVGGSVIGASCALLLAELGFSVVLLDINPPELAWQDAPSLRVSAINLKSQQLFESLGSWDTIPAEKLSEFTKIRVWTEHETKRLTFSGSELGLSHLGHIVENQVLLTSLNRLCAKAESITRLTTAPISLTEKSDEVMLQLADDSCISVNLLVGADGGNSWVRRAVNIDLKQYDYQQKALVCRVKTERAHHTIARQCFLRSGPFGLLPLKDAHESSIVWSADNETHERLSQSDNSILNEKMTTLFGDELGQIEVNSEISTFPLKQQHVARYISNHVVLVGDAAHTIHPLAGQGMNLGLMDVMALARVLAQGRDARKPLGHFSVLRKYERERKTENSKMILAMQGFHQVATSRFSFLQTLMQKSFELVEALPLVKNQVMDYATKHG